MNNIIALCTTFLCILAPMQSWALISHVYDPVNLVISENGKIGTYGIGDKFDFSDINGGYQITVQNQSVSAAKNVNMYWEVRADDSIAGEGDANIMCRDSFFYGVMFPRAYMQFPATSAECPAFETGGRYRLNINVTSTSADIYHGGAVSNWVTKHFTVYPEPKFGDIHIIGNPIIERHTRLVDTPMPAQSEFFVGDEIIFARDMGFENSVETATGAYLGGVYNNTDERNNHVQISYTLFDPGMNVMCVRQTGELAFEARSLMRDYEKHGYASPDIYDTCPAISMTGMHTVRIRVTDTETKFTQSKEVRFLVGTARGNIVNEYVSVPERPIEMEESEILTNEKQTMIAESNSFVKKDACEIVLSELDSDKDGLTDWDEKNVYGSNPYSTDTDLDGYSDLLEILTGHNPVGKGYASYDSTDSLKCVYKRLNDPLFESIYLSK